MLLGEARTGKGRAPFWAQEPPSTKARQLEAIFVHARAASRSWVSGPGLGTGSGEPTDSGWRAGVKAILILGGLPWR